MIQSTKMADPLIPASITAGDTIGIVAPSGQIQDTQRFDAGIRILKDMGFLVKYPKNMWRGAGYFSDTDQNRADEFNRTWADPEVKAVMAARGGYGCLRILDKIDLDLIQRTPKLFLGFSDITVIHSYLRQKTGLVSLHSPVLTSLAGSDKPAVERLFHCLTGKWDKEIYWKNLEILRGGSPASGLLSGGNLSSMASLLGTPFQPGWREKVVFLEDTGEPFYRLDKMLTQLSYSGMFEDIAGLILGDFCFGDDLSPLSKLRHHENVWERALELTVRNHIPVWGGFPAGHCHDNYTLPLGARAIMNSDSATLFFS